MYYCVYNPYRHNMCNNKSKKIIRKEELRCLGVRFLYPTRTFQELTQIQWGKELLFFFPK